MKVKRQNIKSKSLNGKFTIWIEFFLQWNSFLFQTFFFFLASVCQGSLLPPPFSPLLTTLWNLYVEDLNYIFTKHTVFLFIYCMSFSTSLCTEGSGAVAENPNKSSRPSSDVVSLCPTRPSLDSSNKLKPSCIAVIFYFSPPFILRSSFQSVLNVTC